MKKGGKIMGEKKGGREWVKKGGRRMGEKRGEENG